MLKTESGNNFKSKAMFPFYELINEEAMYSVFSFSSDLPFVASERALLSEWEF